MKAPRFSAAVPLSKLVALAYEVATHSLANHPAPCPATPPVPTPAAKI